MKLVLLCILLNIYLGIKAELFERKEFVKQRESEGLLRSMFDYKV